MSQGKDRFGRQSGVRVPVRQVAGAARCTNENAWLALAT